MSQYTKTGFSAVANAALVSASQRVTPLVLPLFLVAFPLEPVLARTPQGVIHQGQPAMVALTVDGYKHLPRTGQASSQTFIDLLLAIPQDDEKIKRTPLPSRNLLL